MKIKIFQSGLFASLIMLFSLVSCKKDNYRTDGGVASATTTLSTYDYLAGNAYHYFDTVLLIVDHFGLKDSLNKSGTFFAPTDYAIHRLMTDNNISTLDVLYKKINSKFITQYMFTDNALTLDNATTSVKTYVNWAGTTVGVSKIAASYYVATTSLTYYTLQYVKINGVLDGSAGAPANDETDAILKCQTTGIQTTTGTNLNVLVNNAVLNLIGDTVVTALSLSYDVNVTQSNDDYTSTGVQLDSGKIAGLFGISVSKMSDMLSSGSDSLKYYALEPDSNLNDVYTANPPGFWFDANGYVVGWGDSAYLFAELDPSTYNVNVGQYPGHAQQGDKYVLKQVFAYTNADGTVFKVTITFNVTLV